MFKDKILLITGGTGSFGNQILKHFLNSNIKEIRIFSRDEKKQEDMRNFYNSEKLKFFLGDVKDPNSLDYAINNVDYLFHAAALKQVPSCEFHPMQAVNTNVIGTSNVLDAAIKYKVKRVVCLSTDKAVYPINAMGMSKALMEKVALAKSRITEDTKIMVTRYGNVMASRGSVIPKFVEQILNKKPLTITDPAMTRFMMDLNEAVNLVMFAFKNGESGDIFVQKSPAATLEVLSQALFDIFGVTNYKKNIIGTRHGEKLFEVLLSREETTHIEDLPDYYRVIPDRRNLNYSKFFQEGSSEISKANEYTSHNTEQLDSNALKKKLLKLTYIKKTLKVGENIEIENL